MPAITLTFENAPASGQAHKDVPVQALTSEPFYQHTRDVLSWGPVNNGMATLPYRDFEDRDAVSPGATPPE